MNTKFIKVAFFLLFALVDNMAYLNVPIQVRTQNMLYLLPGGGVVALCQYVKTHR